MARAHRKVGGPSNDDRILANKATIERRSREALQSPFSDAERLGELYDLDGVGTPVASALLAVWDPAKYPFTDRPV